MHPAQATQPVEHLSTQQILAALTEDHARRLKWEVNHDFRAILLGRRLSLESWDKNDQPIRLTQSGMADALFDPMPDDWLAKVMVLVMDGDEALRADLKASLEPKFTSMVERHIKHQAVEDAILEIEDGHS